MTDRITLTVPASGEYAKAVRMTAAALVSRMDFTYDEVEDVRMAAEEAFVYAIDTLPEDADVRIDFELGDDDIAIVARLGSEHGMSDEDAELNAEYATFILQAVCDRFEFASDEDGPYLRLVKRAENVDAAEG